MEANICFYVEGVEFMYIGPGSYIYANQGLFSDGGVFIYGVGTTGSFMLMNDQTPSGLYPSFTFYLVATAYGCGSEYTYNSQITDGVEMLHPISSQTTTKDVTGSNWFSSTGQPLKSYICSSSKTGINLSNCTS